MNNARLIKVLDRLTEIADELQAREHSSYVNWRDADLHAANDAIAERLKAERTALVLEREQIKSGVPLIDHIKRAAPSNGELPPVVKFGELPVLDWGDADFRAKPDEILGKAVENLFHEARQLVGSDNRIYAFDASTLDAIKALFSLLLGRVLYAEKTILELKDEHLEYFGVHERGRAYRKNSVVTANGSAWIALRETSRTPETDEGAGDWKLMVKRGRDGRDTRGDRP